MEEALIKKIWNDPNFKREFYKNPNLVLKNEFGVDVPREVKISIHEETVNKIHIVLPKY